MEPRFIQFEIKYSHILDFKDRYIPIISKYLSIDDVKFTINNQSSFDEYVTLMFPGNSHQIDFRLDRLILRFEEDLEHISKQMGPTKFFFDVLEEVMKLNTFGQIKVVIINLKAIRFIDDSSDEILKRFEAKYLKTQSDILKGANDYAIVVEKKMANGELHNITFGPFLPEDMAKHNVSQLKGKFNSEISKNGLIASYLFSLRKEKTTFSWFSGKLQEMLENLNRISV
jgi:hypothetical protein